MENREIRMEIKCKCGEELNLKCECGEDLVIFSESDGEIKVMSHTCYDDLHEVGFYDDVVGD